ncbi:MAG: hypothetical protein IJU56_00105 [Clostridia bacterium]|nr:hypothetical protein [Clostridia bacterium]
MTIVLKLCALALAASLFSLFLRAQQSPLTLPLQIAAVAVLAGVVLSTLGGRLTSFFSVLERVSLPSALPQTLFKGAAVCLVSELCAALCRESGSAAAADALSFAGRMFTVVLALPVCETVIETVLELIAS